MLHLTAYPMSIRPARGRSPLTLLLLVLLLLAFIPITRTPPARPANSALPDIQSSA
jgi:hypothetical protein